MVENHGDKEFVYPMYDGYSLPNVPNTALDILGAGPVSKTLDSAITDNIELSGIKKVVVLLADGLGYRMFKEVYKELDFLGGIAKNGIFSPITSGFPSTTAASITTMNTGLTPQEHALHEWVVYFKEAKAPINTLPFTSVYDDSALKGKINPRILYKGPTLYHAFKKAKIPAYIILDKQLINSPYNSLFKEGQTSVEYVKNSDLAIRLRKTLESEKKRSYFYTYLSSIDTITHAYGPGTEESIAEISAVSASLSTGLGATERQTAKETLVILTADHGHTKLDPKKIVYLNKDKTLGDFYAEGQNGKKIPPTGSPRDVFLHITENKLSQAMDHVQEEYGGIAKIMKTSDAIKAGLFGSRIPSRKFIERAGNMLMLPYANKGIWYKHTKDSEFKMLGVHGGLSRDELLIAFAAARLSDII